MIEGQSTEPGGTSPAAKVGPGPRVLVADDNDVNRMLIGTMLKNLGCEVDAVANGREAIDAIGKRTYDIVFMDISMPVMDGMVATRLIRESGGPNAGVTVVAVTAHAMVGDRERFLASGMDGYIAKPFRKNELQAVVEGSIRRA